MRPGEVVADPQRAPECPPRHPCPCSDTEEDRSTPGCAQAVRPSAPGSYRATSALAVRSLKIDLYCVGAAGRHEPVMALWGCIIDVDTIRSAGASLHDARHDSPDVPCQTASRIDTEQPTLLLPDREDSSQMTFVTTHAKRTVRRLIEKFGYRLVPRVAGNGPALPLLNVLIDHCVAQDGRGAVV
jgi:hypothetical protein